MASKKKHKEKVNVVELLTNPFTKMFPEFAKYVNTPEVQKWLSEALVKITEYDQALPNETKNQRDKRMKCAHVYEGEFKELGNCLRNTYPDERTISTQELILKVYAGISNVNDVIKSIAETEVNPTTTDEANADSSENVLDSNKEVTPVTEESGDVIVNNANETATVAEEKDTTPNTETSGNISKDKNNVSILKEDTKMAQVSISDVVGKMDGVQAPEAGAKSNVKKVTSQEKASYLAEAQKMIQADMQMRIDFKASNRIEAIISAQKPAALRTKAAMGTIRHSEKKTYLEVVTEKYLAFAKAVTGRNDITIDAFKALPEDQKFAKVIAADNDIRTDKEGNPRRGKSLPTAKAMADLYDSLINGPEGMEVPAYIPTKVSYGQKGVVIGGQFYNNSEFIKLLQDKTPGGLFASTASEADKENAPYWQLTNVKDKKGEKGGIMSNGQIIKRPSFTAKNKDRFIANGDHVEFLFPTETENASYASFKALVTVDGKQVPASITVQKGDETKQTKNNEVHVVTKNVSLTVSVPVVQIDKKDLAPKFQGDMVGFVLDQYWGVKLTSTRVAADPWSDDVTSAPITKFVADMLQNAASTDYDSALLQKIRQAQDADAKKAAEALATDMGV
jgi:hypothetical protein